jgi:PAS domain S-box-containing protein
LDQILGIGPAYDHSVAGWAALIHPDDRALMVEYLEQEVFSQRQPFDKEYRIVRHNDQAERWVKGLGRMEFDAQGRPVKMIGTIQDITERKQADAALRQSEERYKALFNRSLDCVFLTDFAGNFLDANQASLNLLGFQHEDLSSLTFASLLTEDQLPSAFQTIEEIKATGHQQRLTEYRVRCKDGRQVYVETQSSLIHRDGKPFAIQGIARDITERERSVQPRHVGCAGRTCGGAGWKREHTGHQQSVARVRAGEHGGLEGGLRGGKLPGGLRCRRQGRSRRGPSCEGNPRSHGQREEDLVS